MRPDVPQEVEISEIQEDAGQQEREDESYDDPLVLKGSRPTGAPKEPLEGEVSEAGLGGGGGGGGWVV